MKLCECVSKFKHKIVIVVLCAVLVATNVVSAYATDIPKNEISSALEENTQTTEDDFSSMDGENEKATQLPDVNDQKKTDTSSNTKEQKEQDIDVKTSNTQRTIQSRIDSDASMKITTALIKAEGEDNQLLSNNGTFAVDFSKQFTLHIVVKSTLNLSGKKVEIVVPDGLTIVEYPIPERGDMAESVTPENLADLSGGNYGDYSSKSGTITYSLKSTAEENSFNIIMEPDTVLWNRQYGEKLEHALIVRAYTGDIDDKSNQKTYDEISSTAEIIGQKILTSDNTTYGLLKTGPRLSSIGVKSGVPTVANTPFALRQIWLNPDKDRIDMSMFLKELEITLALPYYMKDGHNIYAELDHISYDYAGLSDRDNKLDPKDNNNSGPFVKKNDNHTVTLTWNNLYLKGEEYFTPYFKWTTDCDNTGKGAIKWGNDLIYLNNAYLGAAPKSGRASVGGKITWQDNSEWYFWNNGFKTSEFTAYSDENIEAQGIKQAKSIYNAYDSDSDIIYYLGQFHVVNHGGVKSAKKTVEFIYNNIEKIGVTAQRIPAGNGDGNSDGNEVTIWYATNKNPEMKKYSATVKSNGGFVTFTAQMAGLDDDEYFTNIRANVGSYERDYVGYVASRSQDPTSGYATTFGKLLSNEVSTYKDFASIKIYNTTDSDGSEVSAKYDVNITNIAGTIPLAMEQAYKDNKTLDRLPILSDPDTKKSKTSATAGDTVTFNGLLSSSAYPYSSNNITTDSEIYIRLPEKITIENIKLYRRIGSNADKVFLSDKVTESATSIITEEIEEGAYIFKEVVNDGTNKLYKITFTNKENPERIGWFTEELGQYQIGISFDMNIAKDADAMTLDMRDCVQMKSTSLACINDQGTLNQYLVADTYDMNQNNNTTEKFATFNVNAKGAKLSVIAARLGLTFTFGAKMTDLSSLNPDYKPSDYSNYEVQGEKVFLKNNSQAVDMLFTLKNETGRAFNQAEAQAFHYFIPVPKVGDFWDSHMQDKAFDFNMKLADEPKINGISKDNILVTYATDIVSTVNSSDNKHYSNENNYVTKEELLKNCNTDEEKAAAWSSVKMIRIAAKDTVTSIRQNAEMEVYMHYVPEFEDNADLVGSIINFGPCGVSPYSVGNTTNQGHNPLPRIQVEFQTGVIEGKIFLDKNFNGKYDNGEELYKGEVRVEAPHQNDVGSSDNESHEMTVVDGTFKFTGRRADSYHVIITNPGVDDVNGENPLIFSLPETGGKFSLGTDSKTVIATITLEKGDGKGRANLEIGLQQPHKVTFDASNAILNNNLVKTWHNTKLGDNIPKVIANKGWQFTGNWTDGINTYTADGLKDLKISKDTKFTAEVKQLYSVTYNGNGNTTGTVPKTTWHIEGEKVRPDYTGTTMLKKDTAIFVGWSETQMTQVLKEDASQEIINNIISDDEHIMPDHNVILYAVWAVDANANGNPDYNDDAVHIRYHGNNGDYNDVICPHHHVVGAMVKLSTTGKVSGMILSHNENANLSGVEIGSYEFTYGTNIFVGWSTKPILSQVIKTKAEYNVLASSIKQEVLLLNKAPADIPEDQAKDTSKYADDDGNTNVYAVWATDRNRNGTADYLEEHVLVYKGNALSSGIVNNEPTDDKTYISGDKVKLSEDRPTHSSIGGKKVVFVGWTENQTHSIYSREDDAPKTITEVTFADADKTIYASWGYDENGNGIADVLETYSLIYNLNGGKGNEPAVQTDIKKGTYIPLTTQKNFTRDANEVFVGWSRTLFLQAFKADQEDDVSKALITGTEIIMGTENIILYAVWAEDQDNDGQPDYHKTYTVEYDLNGGSPSKGVTYEPETMKMGTVCKIKTAPSRSGYTFIGWKDEYGTIYQAGEELVIDADLKLTAQWSSIEDIPDSNYSNEEGETSSPDKPSQLKSTVDSALKTGDEINIVLWFALLVFSNIGIITILRGSKHKYCEKHRIK